MTTIATDSPPVPRRSKMSQAESIELYKVLAVIGLEEVAAMRLDKIMYILNESGKCGFPLDAAATYRFLKRAGATFNKIRPGRVKKAAVPSAEVAMAEQSVIFLVRTLNSLYTSPLLAALNDVLDANGESA